MAVAAKDPSERSPPKARFVSRPVHVAWCNHGLVEDLSAGEVRVQVDVGGQDEVLAVVFRRLAEGDQIGGRGDLVGIVRLARPAAVFGVSREAQREDRDC